VLEISKPNQHSTKPEKSTMKPEIGSSSAYFLGYFFTIIAMMVLLVSTALIIEDTNLEGVENLIMITLPAAVSMICIGLSVFLFRKAGRVVAANGLLSCALFFPVLMVSWLFDGEPSRFVEAKIITFTILGIIYFTLGAIEYRRAKAENLPGLLWNINKIAPQSKLTDKLLSSKLADKVQTPLRRRLIVTIYVLTLLAGAALYIGVETGYASPNILLLLLAIGLFLLMTLLEELLRVCLKPVSGDNPDERQSDLVQSANADSRIATLALISILGIVAIIQIDISIKTAVAALAIIYAFLMPRFILACTLPAESNDDMDDDETFLAAEGAA